MSLNNNENDNFDGANYVKLEGYSRFKPLVILIIYNNNQSEQYHNNYNNKNNNIIIIGK